MNDRNGRAGEIAETVRKRKKLVYLSSIPFFALAAVALFCRITSGRFLGIQFSLAGPAAMIVFLLTLILHVIIWRCPACEGYLGFVGSSKFCPKCGARLGCGPHEIGNEGERR